MLDIICEGYKVPPVEHYCPLSMSYETRGSLPVGTIGRCPVCGHWYERRFDESWYWKSISAWSARRKLRKLGCEVPLA